MVVAGDGSGCPGEAVLAAYAAGELGKDAVQAAESHVRSCAACQGALREIRAGEELATRLRAAVGLEEEAALRASLVSQVAGEYEILDSLGHGAGGAVFKARDVKLNRYVAIKCLARTVSAAAALQEARQCARINHPNVAAVYDVREQAGLSFIVMEFVDGVPITEAAADRALEQQVEIFRQALRAVAEMHRRGIVHRDLKPANILVDRRGAVKVVDFGIARPAETGAGRAEGTPAYIAPEQSRGEGAQATADIFALGVILFEVLTGERPFRGGTAREVLEAIRQADPPLPRALRPEIPGALQAICLTALEKSPELRYPSAQAFLMDLERYLKGEAVAANPKLLASVLEHGIERHVSDLQRWEDDRLISTRECDYLRNRYEQLRQREEFWVLDSRRISFSQVMLHLGAWACVVSAALMLLFSWPRLAVPRPALPWTLLTMLLAGGWALWQRRTKRVAIVLLMAGCIISPVAVGALLVHTGWLTGGEPRDNLLGAIMTNRQLLAAMLAAFMLAAALWRWTRTAAFALIWGLCAIGLATAIFACYGLVAQVRGDHVDIVAGWYLWPGAILGAVAVWFDVRSRMRAFAGPLYVMSLIVVLLSVTVIAASGPTPQWLGFVHLNPEDHNLRSKLVKYSFMINGALYLAAGFITERSVSSSWLRRIGTLLFWLGPSHVLVPVFRLQGEWPIGTTSWTGAELLLPAGALVFVFASVPKQMKSFFFSGLAYLALAVEQLTDRHFQDVLAWPVGLAAGGLALTLVAWRFPGVFDTRSRRGEGRTESQGRSRESVRK